MRALWQFLQDLNVGGSSLKFTKGQTRATRGKGRVQDPTRLIAVPCPKVYCSPSSY